MKMITKVARGQGFEVRRSRRRTGRLWLVDGEGKLASPQRGLHPAEMWRLLAMPPDDPLVAEVWSYESPVGVTISEHPTDH